MRIYSVATLVNECIIFLEEINEKRLVPIWIGISDGQAIAVRFSGMVLPRPLTHDLFVHTVKALGWEIQKVVINDLRENTSCAKICFRRDSSECFVDSRPADAIAVAVCAGCPLYVDESVFARCQILDKPITEEKVKKFKEKEKSKGEEKGKEETFDEMAKTSAWHPFVEGRSLGQHGPERGTILRDEEHAGGARITLERGCTIGPFAVTSGVYRWMVHTRFFSTEESARQAFDQMKIELARIVSLVPAGNDPEFEAKAEAVKRSNR